MSTPQGKQGKKCFTKLTIRGSAKVSRWYNGWTRQVVTGGIRWFWISEAKFSVEAKTVSVECVCLYANPVEADTIGDGESSISNLVMEAGRDRKTKYTNSTFDFVSVDYYHTDLLCKEIDDGSGNGTTVPQPGAGPNNGSMCKGSAEGGPCRFSCDVNMSENGVTNMGAQNQGGNLELAFDDALDELTDTLMSGRGGSGAGKVGPPPGWCGLDSYVDCTRWSEDDLPNPGVNNTSNSTTGNDSRGGPGNSRRTDTVMLRRW